MKKLIITLFLIIFSNNVKLDCAAMELDQSNKRKSDENQEDSPNKRVKKDSQKRELEQQFLKAAFQDDIEIIKKLIDIVDVNTRTQDGNTSLIFACSNGHKAILSLLLNAGADPDLVNDKNQSGFLIAADSGYTEIIDSLIKAKANPNIANLNSQTAFDRVNIRLKSSVGQKILYGNNGSRRTREYLEITEKLKAFNILFTPEYHKKAIEEREKNYKAYLQYNFHNALVNNNIDQVIRLIPEVNINYKDRNGNTPLIHACARNTLTLICEILINSNANMNLQNNNGETALMFALHYNNNETAKLLIESNAQLEIQDNFGETAFFYAKNCQACEYFINLLLEHNANPNIKNNLNQTFVDVARLAGQQKIIDRVQSIFITAANKNDIDVIKKLINLIDIDANDQHNDGNALYHAAKHKNKEIVELLLKAGAHPDARIDNNNNSILMAIAQMHGTKKIVELLLLAGADTQLRNNHGETALFMASRGRTAAALKLILQAGGNPYILNNSGQPVKTSISKKTVREALEKYTKEEEAFNSADSQKKLRARIEKELNITGMAKVLCNLTGQYVMPENYATYLRSQFLLKIKFKNKRK